MSEYFLKGVELQFNDLSGEMQKKLYLNDKEKFKKEVAKSKLCNIRKLIVEDAESDSDTLDEVFKVETEIYRNIENLKMLLRHPNLQGKDNKLKVLAKLDSIQIRTMLLENESISSEILNENLRNETYVDGACYDIIQTILNNPNFKMEDETRKVLAKSNILWIRLIPAENRESSSIFLNQMLREEIIGNDDWKVVEAIKNNPNFKMEDETRKELAKLDEYYYRQIAVEDEHTSEEFLEDMYLKEADEKVLEVIEYNLFKKVNKSPSTLSYIQKRKIFRVLKTLRRSRKIIPLSKYLEQILEIIG